MQTFLDNYYELLYSASLMEEELKTLELTADPKLARKLHRLYQPRIKHYEVMVNQLKIAGGMYLNNTKVYSRLTEGNTKIVDQGTGKIITVNDLGFVDYNFVPVNNAALELLRKLDKLFYDHDIKYKITCGYAVFYESLSIHRNHGNGKAFDVQPLNKDMDYVCALLKSELTDGPYGVFVYPKYIHLHTSSRSYYFADERDLKTYPDAVSCLERYGNIHRSNPVRDQTL